MRTAEQRLLGRRVRVIAPSRFGDLGSDSPADPSSERQADALVELLDHLGLDQVALLPPASRQSRLDGDAPATELIHPLPAGTLRVERA